MANYKTNPTRFTEDQYPPSLMEPLMDFLEELVTSGQSEGTVIKRRNACTRFIHFLFEQRIIRFQDVTNEIIERYQQELTGQDYSVHSVYAYLVSVRQLFGFLEEQTLLFENPTARLIIRKPEQKLGLVLSQKQVNKLLKQPDLNQPIGLRDRAILEILYGTGIRLGECAGLSIFDVDLSNRAMKVLGKGRKERMLPLGKHAVKYYKLYLKEARPILTRDGDSGDALWLGFRGGRPVKQQTIRIQIQKYAGLAELPDITDTHTLRRTCATHMLRGGAHPVAVAQMLGHADLGTLAHYLKTTITDLQDSHEMTNPGK